MNETFEAFLKEQNKFLSIDSSLVYEGRSNAFILIPNVNSLHTPPIIEDAANFENFAKVLEQNELINSYDEASQVIIKEQAKIAMLEVSQDELTRNAENGFDSLDDGLLYEKNGELRIEFVGVGLGVEQISETTWHTYNALYGEGKEYFVDATKTFTYVPGSLLSDEINTLTAEQNQSRQRLMEQSAGEALEQRFSQLGDFDHSDQKYDVLSQQRTGGATHDLNVESTGRRMGSGTYVVMDRFSYEDLERGGEEYSVLQAEINVSNKNLVLRVQQNNAEPTTTDEQLATDTTNISRNVLYTIPLDELSESQRLAFSTFLENPAEELSSLIESLDEHGQVIARNEEIVNEQLAANRLEFASTTEELELLKANVTFLEAEQRAESLIVEIGQTTEPFSGQNTEALEVRLAYFEEIVDTQKEQAKELETNVSQDFADFVNLEFGADYQQLNPEVKSLIMKQLDVEFDTPVQSNEVVQESTATLLEQQSTVEALEQRFSQLSDFDYSDQKYDVLSQQRTGGPAHDLNIESTGRRMGSGTYVVMDRFSYEDLERGGEEYSVLQAEIDDSNKNLTLKVRQNNAEPSATDDQLATDTSNISRNVLYTIPLEELSESQRMAVSLFLENPAEELNSLIESLDQHSQVIARNNEIVNEELAANRLESASNKEEFQLLKANVTLLEAENRAESLIVEIDQITIDNARGYTDYERGQTTEPFSGQDTEALIVRLAYFEEIADSQKEQVKLLETTVSQDFSDYVNTEFNADYLQLDLDVKALIMNQLGVEFDAPEQSNELVQESGTTLLEQVKEEFLSVKPFDQSEKYFNERSEILNNELNRQIEGSPDVAHLIDATLEATYKGEMMDSGMYRFEKEYSQDYSYGGGKSEYIRFEIGVQGHNLRLNVMGNDDDLEQDIIPMPHIRQHVEYEIPLSVLTEEQRQALIDFAHNPSDQAEVLFEKMNSLALFTNQNSLEAAKDFAEIFSEESASEKGEVLNELNLKALEKLSDQINVQKNLLDASEPGLFDIPLTKIGNEIETEIARLQEVESSDFSEHMKVKLNHLPNEVVEDMMIAFSSEEVRDLSERLTERVEVLSEMGFTEELVFEKGQSAEQVAFEKIEGSMENATEQQIQDAFSKLTNFDVSEKPALPKMGADTIEISSGANRKGTWKENGTYELETFQWDTLPNNDDQCDIFKAEFKVSDGTLDFKVLQNINDPSNDPAIRLSNIKLNEPYSVRLNDLSQTSQEKLVSFFESPNKMLVESLKVLNAEEAVREQSRDFEVDELELSSPEESLSVGPEKETGMTNEVTDKVDCLIKRKPIKVNETKLKQTISQEI